MAHFRFMILLALDLRHLDGTLSDQVMALLCRGHSLTGTPLLGKRSPSEFFETMVSKAPGTFSAAPELPKPEAPTGQPWGWRKVPRSQPEPGPGLCRGHAVTWANPSPSLSHTAVTFEDPLRTAQVCEHSNPREHFANC